MSSRRDNDKEEVVWYSVSTHTDGNGWTHGSIEPVKMTKKEKAKWDNITGAIILFTIVACAAFFIWLFR